MEHNDHTPFILVYIPHSIVLYGTHFKTDRLPLSFHPYFYILMMMKNLVINSSVGPCGWREREKNDTNTLNATTNHSKPSSFPLEISIFLRYEIITHNKKIEIVLKGSDMKYTNVSICNHGKRPKGPNISQTLTCAPLPPSLTSYGLFVGPTCSPLDHAGVSVWARVWMAGARLPTAKWMRMWEADDRT